MMKSSPNNKNRKLLPFDIVLSATQGDIQAIEMVLSHYKAYICKLSQRPYQDENGIWHLYIDEEIKNKLEVKLISKILDFRMA